MSNPLFSEKAFSASRTDYTDQGVMTLNGTINKSILLFATMLLPAAWLWFKLGGGSNLDYAANNGLMTYAITGMIVGLISSLVMMFKKSLSPYLAPIYAAAEGLFLGAISMIFEAAYEGIVLNAIGITLLVFAVMLLAYRSGLLRATPMFTKVIVFATMGVGVFYLITMIMGFFGVESFYYGNSPMSIGISALIAGIAAFNLILDFSFIEKQSKAGAPKYMEWFSGVALLMTLVWLYLEILRLLAKLQSRD